MKSIAEFSNETDAQLYMGLLQSNGIKSQLQGSLEYTAIVLGGTQGRFKVTVAEEDFAAARKLLIQPLERLNAGSETATTVDSPKSILKKAIFLGFCGMIILPIVFHIFSIQKFIQYWKLEKNSSAKIFWLVFILLIYLASGFSLYKKILVSFA